SIPAIVIGLAPSMYHKKHQNRPPLKDQFHGIIEKLHSNHRRNKRGGEGLYGCRAAKRSETAGNSGSVRPTSVTGKHGDLRHTAKR
ncbi:MAG: hypothetical protein QM844_22725, partial [Planctomycetota bacterium]|nr:hypothetical protein [Planctomycetota bacterium]